METLLTMDLSEISVITKEERCLVTVDIDRHTTLEEEVKLITAETARYQLGRLHDPCGQPSSRRFSALYEAFY